MIMGGSHTNSSCQHTQPVQNRSRTIGSAGDPMVLDPQLELPLAPRANGVLLRSDNLRLTLVSGRLGAEPVPVLAPPPSEAHPLIEIRVGPL